MKATKRELSSVGSGCLSVQCPKSEWRPLLFEIRLFEIRFIFWIMCKHVSHFVW